MGVISPMQLNKQPSKKSRKSKQLPAMPSSGISYLNLISLSEYPNNNIGLIATVVANNNCNIINTRITELGKDIACTALISGKWNNIIKLEKACVSLIKKHNLNMQVKRNSFVEPGNLAEQQSNQINYIARATTINRPDLLDKLLQFFSKQNISIKEANISALHAHSNLINLEIQIKIPADQHINSLREEFLTHCDNLNLDISLEPLG
jgi:glycine cleavage system transcriptional repressor